VFLILTGGAAACSSSPPAPTVTDPGGPTISCPAPPAPVQAADGSGAIVNFGAPIAALGSAPLIGPTCNPSSGSRFAPGTTVVTCTVTDSKARSASCAFPVVVQLSPKLALTRFIAFGDSMTAGEVVSEGFGLNDLRTLQIDKALSYPTDLQRLLDVRYQGQVPGAFVENDGLSGETTTQGRVRLQTVVSQANQPQVLLLLEGVNDLSSTSGVTQAVLNLDAMVSFAKNRGLRVVVGTLPPENPIAPTGTGPSCVARNGGYAFVTPFNNALKIMAAAENIPVADVYQAFNGDVTTLIDCDGLHPTALGYQTIAQSFFDVITKTFEVAPATTATPASAPSIAAPHRR
jgi:lysophospholipase L1-like esterase